MRWLIGCGLILVGVVACNQPDDSELFAEQGSTGQSCVDSCGAKSPDGTCSCTIECATTGDCCQDVATACSFPVFDAGTRATGGSGGTSASGTGGVGTGGTSTGGTGAVGGSATGGAGGAIDPAALSCAGLCGGPAADEACWCDDQCQAYGDCCPDYTQVCNAPPPPVEGGCAANLCGSVNPALENGNPCYCDPSCNEYGDCCANYSTICPP